MDGTKPGISLLEICCKVNEAIMDSRIKEVVVFHKILHGFLKKLGTGTAIIEFKFLQEIACISQVPLFAIFLDLRKAYDTLDR